MAFEPHIHLRKALSRSTIHVPTTEGKESLSKKRASIIRSIESVRIVFWNSVARSGRKVRSLLFIGLLGWSQRQELLFTIPKWSARQDLTKTAYPWPFSQGWIQRFCFQSTLSSRVTEEPHTKRSSHFIIWNNSINTLAQVSTVAVKVSFCLFSYLTERRNRDEICRWRVVVDVRICVCRLFCQSVRLSGRHGVALVEIRIKQ